jgi:hypothetical protein
VIADEVVPVARAVVGALVDAGVTLTGKQVDALQLALSIRLWPLLGAEDQAVVAAESMDLAIAAGRAILVMDEDGRRSYWRGEET